MTAHVEYWISKAYAMPDDEVEWWWHGPLKTKALAFDTLKRFVAREIGTGFFVSRHTRTRYTMRMERVLRGGSPDSAKKKGPRVKG